MGALCCPYLSLKPFPGELLGSFMKYVFSCFCIHGHGLVFLTSSQGHWFTWNLTIHFLVDLEMLLVVNNIVYYENVSFLELKMTHFHNTLL